MPQQREVDGPARRFSVSVWMLILWLAAWNSDAVAQPKNASGEAELIAIETFDQTSFPLTQAGGGFGWRESWKASRVLAAEAGAEFIDGNDPAVESPQSFAVIRGTGDRNNPIRRSLQEPVKRSEVFVAFDLRYRNDVGLSKAAEPAPVDPEFFVLWLDRVDGGDRATHSQSVPNIGIHQADRGPAKGRNVFMIRTGPANTAWSKIEPRNGHWHRMVARLAKTGNEPRSEYSSIDLWIDPDVDDAVKPDATLTGAASVSVIQWLGFSTGVKTEPDDEISVRNLVLTRSWSTATGNVSELAVEPSMASPGHNGVVWNQTVDFRRDVYPVLQDRCFACHAGENSDSGYRLDVLREYFGYSTGEVLAVRGRSNHSRLIEVVASAEPEQRMPPQDEPALADEQIAMLKAWIDQGMPWDEELLPTPQIESDHWAFQPVTRPQVPTINDSWGRTPVDAFIAKSHLNAGLQHSSEAPPETLARRLYLDLIGLPPTPEQLTEFLQKSSEDPSAELIEELLASPHYGERWGRYWLDLARWAESQGYQHDFVRLYAWRYRDYVIDSFNQDKPYDRFIKEQLAGDELQPYSDENLIATGFLAAARISGNQEDDAIQRNDVMVDIVNATGSVMLGLTLECAQCHNHKIDPISQRDYYRMQAFFIHGQLGNLSLRDPDVPNPTNISEWIPKPSFDFYSKEVKSLTSKKLYQPTDRPHTWGYLSAATGDPGIERFPVVNRRPIRWQPSALKSMQAHMLIRGDAGNPGPPVRHGWPEVLGTTPESLGTRSRSALADWMTDRRNPLVARVWVNRIWQYHFGRGLVATASDFGVGGAEPSHPELLNWLACELMDHGWSTKHIHRLIVQSAVYRQQRKYDEANAAIDPNNQLLWTWPRRRLEAEAIRDSVLVATGELDRSIGGISVPPEREEQKLRRTIYLFQQRSAMPSVMEMFDGPGGIASCSRRAVSTVALQPLFLLNSEFMARRATSLAERVSEAASDVDSQIDQAFLRTLSRRPAAEERLLAKEILEDSDGPAPLTRLCLALLNLNEFVYIP